jgi:hypothetical protein
MAERPNYTDYGRLRPISKGWKSAFAELLDESSSEDEYEDEDNYEPNSLHCLAGRDFSRQTNVKPKTESGHKPVLRRTPVNIPVVEYKRRTPVNIPVVEYKNKESLHRTCLKLKQKIEQLDLEIGNKMSSLSEQKRIKSSPKVSHTGMKGSAQVTWIDELGSVSEQSNIDQFPLGLPSSTPMVENKQKKATDSFPVSCLQMGLLNLQGLPTLSLNVFEGDPVEWPEWSLSFRNLINDNLSLNESKKLGYLRTYLGDEPRSKIYGLLLNGKSYTLAMKELQRCYGNPAFVVEAFVQKVRTWAPIKDSSEIGSFCTQVSQLVQMFSTMGYESDLTSIGLLSDLVGKLPLSMRESWGGFVVRFGKRLPTVELFHEWLLKKEEALRYGGGLVGVSKIAENRTKNRKQGEGIGPVHKPTVRHSTLFTPSQNKKGNEIGNKGEPELNPGGDRSSVSCYFCEQNHCLRDCSQFIKKCPEDRLMWFKSERRCFLCCRKNHVTRLCRSRMRCTESGCDKRHCALLHHAFPSDSRFHLGGTTARVGVMGHNSTIYLQILPVRIHSPNGRIVETYAILDPGSQATLIQSSFAKDLGLNGPISSLTIGGIHNNKTNQQAKNVSFCLSNPSDPSMRPIKVKNGWTFDKPFNLPSQIIPKGSDGVLGWSHVQDLGLHNIESNQIMLLIGADTKGAMMQLEVRPGPDDLPMAVHTPLGWTIMGTAEVPTPVESEGSVSLSTHLVTMTDYELDKQVERFWTTESFGCTHNHTEPISIQDGEALKILDSTVRIVDNHYEVGMLWADLEIKLINNRPVAERRFASLDRKLQKNEKKN